MPRPPRLSDDELAAALTGLPLWSGDGDGLRRTVELPSFRDAVAAIVASPTSPRRWTTTPTSTCAGGRCT